MKLNRRGWYCGRLLLLVAGLVAALVLGEVGLRAGLRWLPVRLHGYFDEGVRVLAQGTKRGLVPRDYLALVGDSHALGMGDGFGERASGESWFGLASLLHERLGRDVITYGASGAGSLRGVVAEPVVGLAAINAMAGLRMAPPDGIVVLFYEGNDLNDNLVDLVTRYQPQHDMARLGDDAYFQDFIAREILANDPLNPLTHRRSWVRQTLLLSFLLAQAKPGGPEKFMAAPVPAFWRQDSNRVVVGGGPVGIPGHLQGPGLELNADEIALSAYIFGQALACLVRTYPEAEVMVLYVPSVLSCYAIAGKSVSTESYHFREMIYPAGDVAYQSDRIFGEVAAVARAQGVGLIDSRARLREAAQGELLHGPADWYHLNRRGYGVLGDCLVEGMEGMEGMGRGGE